MKFNCAHCGKSGDKPPNELNRARREGRNIYCDRRCSGLGRRDGKTKAQRVEEKRLYDLEYRAKNIARILARKKEYFKRTYDPVKAAVERKKNMARHVQYCRRPEYKRWKSDYDRQHRAKEFGPFAEAYLLTVDLNRAIKGRMTNAQIKWENGTANKIIKRRRDAKAKERSRPRWRDRRDRHQAANGG